MSDTSFSKPSHTNGPSIKLYDLGGLPYPQGPYAEAAAMLGWDPVGLQWVKVHVDSNGNINTVGGTTTSTIAGSVIVTQGTASNLNATVVGTVTSVPSGTQPVSGTVTSISGTASNLLAQVSGTVTSVPSGTQSVSIAAGTAAVTQATSPWVVSQGTASNFQATVTGTVALSGTQTVVGTVTNVPSGTQAVSQTGSPWGVSGTVTTTPSGTQTVAFVSTSTVQPLRSVDFSGTATISSTSNSTTFNFQDCSVGLLTVSGTWTGTVQFQGLVPAVTVLPLYNLSGAAQANPIIGAGVTANTYEFFPGGFSSVQLGVIALTGGTATFVLEASQAIGGFNPIISLGTTTVVGTVTVVPSGTQTTLPTGTLAVSQSGAPWSVSVTTQTSVGASVYLNQNLGTVGTAIKTASGNLYGYDIAMVPGTAASYVKLYNKSTTPTATDTPVMVLQLGEAAALGTQISPGNRAVYLNPPVFFSSGIGIRAEATTTNSGSATPGVTVVNIFYS